MVAYEDYERERRIKKSNFAGQTAMASADTLDFVRNGQNYKITFANFLSAIAAIGTIETLGEVSGTPVLDKAATVNYIRNLLAGPGVSIALSPEDGIKISHRLQSGTGEVAVLTDTTEDSPVIRSITAGGGMVATGSDETIVLSTTGGAKTVLVHEISDLPTAFFGTITLEDDTEYRLTNDIVTPFRLLLGNNTVLTGLDDIITSLTYLGAGTMLYSTESTNKIKNLACICPYSTFINWTATLSNAKVFQMTNCSVTCDTIGTASGFRLFSATNVRWEATTNGMVLSGTNSFFNMHNQVVIMTTGKFLDFDSATFSGISLQSGYAIMSSGTYLLSGLADSGNINAGGLASVVNFRLLGDGAFLETIASYDGLWEFNNNDGVQDSVVGVLSTMVGEELIISATNTPVKITGPWVVQGISRFTDDLLGKWTYTGKGSRINIATSFSVDLTGGTDDCTFYIYKNGTQIAESAILASVKDGDPRNVGLLWAVYAATGDYFELYAENNDTSTNINFYGSILRIID